MAATGRLRIPKLAQEGLAQLMELNDNEFQEVEAALRHAEPKLFRGQLASFIASRVSTRRESVEEIIRVVVSLYLIRTARKQSIPEFVEGLRQAIEAEDEPRLKPKDDDWEPFKARLASLLSLEQSIGITSKAFDVMSDHPRVYCTSGARVLTDIRSVFSDDLTELPAAAVIVHTLKIPFHEEGSLKEFFVAMDARDLRSLREALDRAEQKGERLQAFIEAAKVQYLDPDLD
jgi:hypothetical protein